jgi:ATP-binding cassette subfamily B protein
MARTKLDLRGDAYRKVLGFLMGHWAHQPGRVLAMFALFMLATAADVLTPLFAGNLVTAVSNNVNADGALNAALWAFGLLIALGLGSVVARQFAFMVLIQFTLKIMADIAQSAFHRVQRFSTDWHANTFAGSTVRKVTRGMWGVDMLNDTLIIMLFPSLVMLVGTSILLGVIWPLMGLVISIGSLIYVVLTVVLSVGYVSPAATLANAWDTRMGGALADAISCNAVVKGFGAEDREEERLSHVVGKWRVRTERRALSVRPSLPPARPMPKPSMAASRAPR